jgi:hypothetical protein
MSGMSKTVKRALWQRTLETAGPLRKALPVAPNPASCGISERLSVNVRFDTSALESWLAKWQRSLEHVEERGYRQAKRTMLFGMDFAQGGVRDQTVMRLVGERGPEMRLTIPAGKLKVGEPVAFSQYADLFLFALPQMVREINEASGERDADHQS